MTQPISGRRRRGNGAAGPGAQSSEPFKIGTFQRQRPFCRRGPPRAGGHSDNPPTAAALVNRQTIRRHG